MKKMTTKLTLAAAVTFAMATLAAPMAQAQSAPEATPNNVISYNATVTTDYRFRGISQSRSTPALQGGVDFVNNPTGLYVGAWASTIRWTSDLRGDGYVELDIYAGKRGEIAKGLTYDVGGLAYLYPENDLAPRATTYELYSQLGYGPAYIKYSHSTSNLFGTANSKNSRYLDVGFNIELDKGLVLNLHAGRQRVKNNEAFSYSDYKIGVTQDLGWASIAFAAVTTNTDMYISPVKGNNLGKTAAVVSLTKTF